MYTVQQIQNRYPGNTGKQINRKYKVLQKHNNGKTNQLIN